MSQELHYTSVPRGLKPGSRGFCSVAWTAQISGPLVERLEGLSGYQPVYPPHDPAAVRNPINFSHIRLTLGARTMSVLSRIGPAGLDYTGRANKYAHHVVLETNERPEGGPAWLISQPGFLQAAWEGEPRVLTETRPVLRGDRPAGIAQAWHALTGDGGWAGMLAESFLADLRRPVFLVFRPGMDLLPLFVEAIALLPPSRRWEVEFSTYLTQLPNGVSCPWRGVLEGSAEARNAGSLPNSLVLDLCRPAGQAQGGALVHLARTGERRDEPVVGIAEVLHPGQSRGTVPIASRPTPIAGPLPRTVATGGPANYGLIPELAARMESQGSTPLDGRGRPPHRPGRPRGLIAGVLAACLVTLLAMGFSFRVEIRMLIGSDPQISQLIADTGKEVSDKKREDDIIRREVEEERKARADNPASTPEVSAPLPKKLESEKPSPIDAPKSSKPSPPNPEVRSPIETPTPQTELVRTITPLFFPLEEPSSQFGPTVTQKTLPINDPAFQVDRLELVGIEGGKLSYKSENNPNPRLDVYSKASVGLAESNDGIRLAAFEVSPDRQISFRWEDTPSSDRIEDRRSLRACVLKITSKGQGERYCVLRDQPSAPQNSQQFSKRLDIEKHAKRKLYIYRWDQNDLFYDQFARLALERCKLNPPMATGRNAPKLEKRGDHSWSVAGEALFTISLEKLVWVNGKRVLKDKDADRGGAEPLPRPPDHTTVVVLELCDGDPDALQGRIAKLGEDIKEERDRASKVEKSDERERIQRTIQQYEKERIRLKKLLDIHLSFSEATITWNLAGLKLELGHLNVKQFAQDEVRR
jgi:hypothetical protein